MDTNHSIGRSIRVALASGVFGCALVPAVATAQELMLEEIIVTATKRAESLQEVPIAVSALQGDELLKAGIDSQRAISMTTPNVVINVNANFVAPYIRGIGTQYANPGLEPSVAMYFNDLYISRPNGGLISFNDIERVEVLKGPQGTLYGRNTTGGAVRVITKDPTDEFEYGIGLEAGNFNKKIVDGYVSGPLMDTLKGRFSFKREKRDGFIENLTGPDVADRDLYMGHSKLMFEPTDALSIKWDVDYAEKSDHEGVAFQPLFDGSPEQVAAGFPGAVFTTDKNKVALSTPIDNRRDQQGRSVIGGTQLRIDYEMDFATFSSITGYRFARFRGKADLDGTSVDYYNANTLNDETKDYSQEFQLVSADSGRWDWVAGVFLFREEALDDFGATGLAVDGGLSAPPALGGFGVPITNAFVGGQGDITVDSYAPYGQVSFDITDQLEIMVGARYTDETKEVENRFFLAKNDRNYPASIPLGDNLLLAPPAPVAKGEFSFSKTTPKVQLTWRPDDGKMVYLSYSEGIKSGGFNMPHPAPGLPKSVESEKVKAYELGWKTEFERVRINGALFHYTIDNLQVQITDGSGAITTVENVDGAEVTGIETDILFAASENLQIATGIGYQQSEFNDGVMATVNEPCANVFVSPGVYNDLSCTLTGGAGLTNSNGDVGGNDLPQSPELTAYLRGTYFVPLDDNGELAFSFIANYKDEFYYTSDNNFGEPSNTLINSNVTWTSADEVFVVSGYITNLTDEVYYTHNAPFAASGGWKVRGEPRMYGMRVGLNF